jgi:hypothetical protein
LEDTRVLFDALVTDCAGDPGKCMLLVRYKNALLRFSLTLDELTVFREVSPEKFLERFTILVTLKTSGFRRHSSLHSLNKICVAFTAPNIECEVFFVVEVKPGFFSPP